MLSNNHAGSGNFSQPRLRLLAHLYTVRERYELFKEREGARITKSPFKCHTIIFHTSCEITISNLHSVRMHHLKAEQRCAKCILQQQTARRCFCISSEGLVIGLVIICTCFAPCLTGYSYSQTYCRSVSDTAYSDSLLTLTVYGSKYGSLHTRNSQLE